MDSDVNFPNECREEDGEEEGEEREGEEGGRRRKGKMSKALFLPFISSFERIVTTSLFPFPAWTLQADREWRVILEEKAETQEVTT